MKTIKITVLFLFLLTMSCSNSASDDEVQNENTTIEGIWVLRDMVLDEAALAELFESGVRPIVLLTSLNCNLISLEFNADKTFIGEQYGFDIVPGSSSTDPDFECINPESSSATWSLNDNLLTLTLPDGFSSTMVIRFEFGRLILEDAEGFAFQRAVPEELIFEKLGQG